MTKNLLPKNLLQNHDFILGLKDALPVYIAFAFMSLSFGGLAHNSQLSLFQTLGLSAIYAMPLQILLLSLIPQGLGLTSAALLTLIVNARFFLMTLTLLPYFKKHRSATILLGLPWIASSAFTVSHVKFSHHVPNDPFSYYLGVALPGAFCGFIFSTIGFYLSSITQNPLLNQAFSMALAIHFMGLTAMRWPKYRLVIATLAGFAITPILNHWLSAELSILAAPLIIAIIMLTVTQLPYFQTKQRKADAEKLI